VRLAGLGAWSVDLTSNELWWSEEVFRLYELPIGVVPTLEQAIGYYTPQAQRQVEEGLARLLATGEPFDLELMLVTARGRTLWVRAIGDLERTNDGSPLRMYGIVQDITAQRDAQEALRQREERMWLALRGNEDGVWDWNVADSSIYFSERWKAILGFADHEIGNALSVWESLVHPDDLPGTLARIEGVIAGESDVYRVQFRMRHRDQGWRWVLSRAKVVARDGSGRATRLVGTHTDITEQVELQEDLVRAKSQAESAARAKAEFLATMSHEIRTPMNGVLGMAQLLETTALDGDQRQMVETIRASGESLLVILNDILDLSKVEAGKLELEQIPFDVRRVVVEVHALLEPQALAKGLEFRVECDASLPPCFVGDPVRLRQVLLNLAGNALKFTERGSIVLRAAPGDFAQGDDPRGVLLQVTDTGVGISKEQRARLFESFSQGDRSTTRRFGGTGLGLAISRRIVELMGGDIQCESEPGRGSTFSVRCALAEGCATPALEPLQAVRAPLPAQTHERVRVLLVEDNAVNQLVARRMLEALGCEVEVAANGRIGLERACAERFALVFMDCHMPEMDGLEATRRLRSHEHRIGRARTTVVALTASAFEEDREKCFAAGADDHVAKPVDRAALARCVARWSAESHTGAPSSTRPAS
jgi:two-component system sensor histidine kinase/response regulator